MMGKKPEDRHDSWHAVGNDIKRILNGKMPASSSPGKKILKAASNSNARNPVHVPTKPPASSRRLSPEEIQAVKLKKLIYHLTY